MDECDYMNIVNASNPCTAANVMCVNTVGSFMCSCAAGYELNIETGACDETDECDRENDCDQVCVDKVAMYSCDCNDGFRLNEANNKSCLRKHKLL